LSELQRRTLELDSLESDRKRAEDALRESEAKFQTLVEQIPNAVIYMAALDERSSTLYISPQIEDLLGYSQEEYKADSDIWAKRIHPDDYDRVIEALNRCHQTGTQFNSEYRMIRKDNRVIWFHDVADIVRDHHGNPLYIIGVNTDMTERKQAEDLVRIQCDLAFALGSTSELGMTLDHVLDAGFQVEGIDCGGVYMVDESTGALDLVAHKGLSRFFVESVSHYDVDKSEGQLVMQGTPIYGLFSKIAPNTYAASRSEGLQALAVIPVKYEGDVVAVLNLSSHTHEKILPGARKALEALATQIGGVLARVRTEEALQRAHNSLERRKPRLPGAARDCQGFSEGQRANPTTAYLQPKDREQTATGRS
jgi:PAS domain S-box-containing protein